MSMCSLCKVAVFFVCAFVRPVDGSTDVQNWPWAPVPAPRLQRVAAGRRAVLRCAGRVEDAPAHWDFKPCGAAGNATSCADAVRWGAGAWAPLRHARSSFALAEAAAGDSGLYRCREAASERINVYSTVQLEVLNGSDEDASLPQFLEGLLKNVSVSVEDQVIFQCKVSSRSKPTIVWLVEGRGPFQYHGHYYQPVNSTGEMALPGGIYLSKMIISEVRENHAGRYCCVAINTKGFANNSAFLTVLPPKSKGSDHGYSSIYWLFSMPVALAVIPLLLWSFFLCSRCNRRAKPSETLVCSECRNGRLMKRNVDLTDVQIELMSLYRSRTIPEDDII